ncbi:GNAT family N-acetyltransferase [Alteromonas sp. SM 2104]|nr:GNAT family N-acetyltransferase [Alteromonas oceanisediminis]
MFVLEPVDERVICEPQASIIQPGGYIWFARHPSFGICGTCALMKKNDGSYELTKMGVSSSARGAKIGETLLKFVLAEIKRMQLPAVFLLTNKRCESAIHLYLKHGFEHDPFIMQRYGQSYERCDVAMRLTR